MPWHAAPWLNRKQTSTTGDTYPAAYLQHKGVIVGSKLNRLVIKSNLQHLKCFLESIIWFIAWGLFFCEKQNIYLWEKCANYIKQLLYLTQSVKKSNNFDAKSLPPPPWVSNGYPPIALLQRNVHVLEWTNLSEGEMH